MTVNILGTEYTISWVSYGEDQEMTDNKQCGSCGYYSKEIKIVRLKTDPDCQNEPDEVIARAEKTTLRHEIIHAFLNESGLRQCSNDITQWARNEEMIDWFALQSPKLIKAFAETNCL